MSETAVRQVIVTAATTFKLWEKDANAIIDALDAAGFLIVPKEPTAKMLDRLYGLSGETRGSDDSARYLYGAMIAAAKEPP